MKQFLTFAIGAFSVVAFSGTLQAQQRGEVWPPYGYTETSLDQVPFQTSQGNRGQSEDRRAPTIDVFVQTAPVVPVWTEQFYDPMAAVVPSNAVPPRVMQTWSVGVFR